MTPPLQAQHHYYELVKLDLRFGRYIIVLTFEHPVKRIFIRGLSCCMHLIWTLDKIFSSSNHVFIVIITFTFCYQHLCSGSVVVTAYDSESGRPGSNPEWRLIYYEAPITAQGLPEPSSLLGSTLGTRTAEHKGCNW